MSKWKNFVLIAGMLISGSINTLSKRAQNQSESPGLDGKPEKFKKPWFQTLFMFAGECMCLLVLLTMHQRSKAANPVKNYGSTGTADDARPEEDAAADREINGGEFDDSGNTLTRCCPLWLLLVIPTLFDVLGTTFAGIGLLYVSASAWQLLRGSTIAFSGLLSVIFLKRKLKKFHWIGIGIVVSGLAAVALKQYLESSAAGKSSDESSANAVLGVTMILIGQLLSSAQMVFEEQLMKKRKLPPLQVVGTEGLWGVFIMCLLVLPVIYFIPGNDHGSYENALDAIEQVKNSWPLIIFLGLYFLSIGTYNFFGMSVAKSLSTVHRTLIDALRTIVVWTVEVFIHYVVTSEYGEAFNYYSFLQVAGFVALLIGTLIYNEVISFGDGDDKEQESLLPHHESPAKAALVKPGVSYAAAVSHT